MKKIINVLLALIMCFLTTANVFAEGEPDAPASIAITDVLSNDLFEITAEYTAEQSAFKNYASHVKTANPENVTLSSDYTDGLRETEETYVDITGKAITFPKDEGLDENYFVQSKENENVLVFAGNKYHNGGFIQMTDKNKNTAYTALYDYTNNVIYTLPAGYEMSRLNQNGVAYLYQLSENKEVLKAYQITLKSIPVPWVSIGGKFNNDIVPVIEDGNVLIPLRSVFEKYRATVEWDEEIKTVTITKAVLNPSEFKFDDMVIKLTIGSTTATKNGEEITLKTAPVIKNGRTLIPAEFIADCFGRMYTINEEVNSIVLSKNSDYWRTVGYEDAGYESPALSSDNPYPDYIKAEVEETIETVKALQTEDTINFTFITDLHFATNNNHSVRMARTTNSYKEIAKEIKMQQLLLGGDYTNEGRKDYKINTYIEFKKFFEGLDYLPANGNHDDGSLWDREGYINNPTAVNHLTHKELYELMYSHLPELGAKFNENEEENSSLYYYLDDEDTKIRYIVIDSGDVPYTLDEEGKLKYQAQWDFAMSQKQVDWLVNDALKFDEEGWGVVVTTHYVPYPESEKGKVKERRHMSILTDILDAYKNGESINADYYEGDFANHVEADFSEYVKSDIIAVLAGDRHKDRLEYSEAGIPHIFTANSVTYYAQSNRKDGDKSEMLYDVITLNRPNRKLYITRVGAGENREASY